MGLFRALYGGLSADLTLEKNGVIIGGICHNLKKDGGNWDLRYYL
jgi:hypothetical protein